MKIGHLPASKIVKAFNAIMAKDLETHGLPSGTKNRRALPIAGDDTEAKKVVTSQFGFDLVDAGDLSESWRFERAKPAYCIPFNSDELKAALKKAERTVNVPEGSWRR